MTTLTKEQQEKLQEAFSSICNLSFATEKDNFSTCGCFHIQPFFTHWDRKTVKEVMYQIKLYINTWVIPKMEDGLMLSKKKVEKYERQRHKEAMQRKRDWELNNFPESVGKKIKKKNNSRQAKLRSKGIA